MASKTVTVPNIHCGHCVMTIEREVGEHPGVLEVTAQREARTVTVSWDPEATHWGAIESLMQEINFPPAG